MTTFHGGRLPAHPEDTHPRLHLSPYLTAAAPPSSVDWHSEVPGWPMYLNDQIGDCTEAMVGHIVEAASTYGRDATVMVGDQDVLTAYERVSGYNPADPSTDQGAVLQDVYGDWRKVGVGGHRNLVFAQVNHRNLDEVRQSVAHFGAAGLGIVVTQSMMDDFDAGEPWARSTGQQLGGHAVPIVGYDAKYVYVVTWGRVQAMTWACLVAVTDEAWAAVLPEWLNAAGHDPEGLDLYGLGEAFHELTGQANPFPAPSPTPVPPGPPAPPVVTADEALAAAAGPWLSHHHTGTNRRFAEAVQAWIDAKGL
jgi:hypothetical protein